MYGLVRIILGCLLFLVIFLFARKNGMIRRRTLCFIAVISVAVTVLLGFLPFENAFITFDSAEKAYEYYIPGKSNIEIVIEGNESDLVIDYKNETETYLIVPKTKEGWKIGIGSNIEDITRKISDNIIIHVFRYKNTDDYFVTIFDVNGNEINISDDCNTEFHPIKRNNKYTRKSYVTYYAYIYGLDLEYELNVNGEKVLSVKSLNGGKVDNKQIWHI